MTATCAHCGRTPNATRHVAGAVYCAQAVEGRPACAVLADWPIADPGSPEQSWWDALAGGHDRQLRSYPPLRVGEYVGALPPARGVGATEPAPGAPRTAPGSPSATPDTEEAA